MKKTLLTLLISAITLGAYSQDYKDKDYYYYDGIENYKGMKISSEQKRKIIEIKKSIGRRHSEIGRDRSLRGYEKGEAHRKLNQQVRKEIYDVLDTAQRNEWDNTRKNWDKKDRDIERRIDAIEDEIDRVEDYYEDLIDSVEDNKSLSKSVRKAKKRELEQEMEVKKAELKRQKEALKNSRY